LWPGAVEAGDAGDLPVGDAPMARPADAVAVAAAAAAVSLHCRMAIDAAGPACVAVKLQLACFERLGAAGWRALADTVAATRSAGLLAIADGKRGDVPVSAAAYAQALVGSTPSPWGELPGLGADAITVNGLLGPDSLEPFVEAAAGAGAGVFVLCRTSNPGAAQLQDLDTAAGGTVSDRLAEMIDELGAGVTGQCGLSAVGAVTGATAPEHLARLREAMPRAVFLLPGVGAQGGEVGDLAAAFSRHPAGGLVTVSRSLVNAWKADGGDPAEACRRQAETLRERIWTTASAAL
jgi:orotidine-5'-phosphate decarboxylase